MWNCLWWKYLPKYFKALGRYMRRRSLLNENYLQLFIDDSRQEFCFWVTKTVWPWTACGIKPTYNLKKVSNLPTISRRYHTYLQPPEGITHAYNPRMYPTYLQSKNVSHIPTTSRRYCHLLAKYSLGNIFSMR